MANDSDGDEAKEDDTDKDEEEKGDYCDIVMREKKKRQKRKHRIRALDVSTHLWVMSWHHPP
jgi:hypothetical protein